MHYARRVVIEQMAAQGYEVYAPDFPGHGSSSKVRHPQRHI